MEKNPLPVVADACSGPDHPPAASRCLPSLAAVEVRIAPNRIHFLKFILEGYDGLAVLSTLDPQQGLVRLRYPVEVKHEVFTLLRELDSQLGGVFWLDADSEQQVLFPYNPDLIA
jgi:hypothetical protein